jgi:type IV secretory pathway VirB10-like protein
MSDDQGPILPDADAEPIELEPRPRVVRLNRRAIFVAGGLLTAVLLAAVFTLSERSKRTAERREQQSGVSAAPDRFWEGEPDGVPRLPVPPELPEPVSAPTEDSDVPVLDAGAPPQLIEPAAAAADETLRRAYASRPIVYEGRAEPRAASAQTERAPRPSSSPSGLPSVLDDAQDLIGAAQREEDAVVSQNLQREKAEFLRNAKLGTDEEINDHLVRPALTPYEVKAGSLVPAVLITQANSDLPGQLIAQVRENVFDSATGAHLLIPQGTRAIGVYDSVVAFGQERVLVAWQRLIFPDGSSLNLGSMAGTDLAGAAGFHDRVERDYLRIFGGAVLLSAISAGVQISQGTFASGNQATDTSDLREILAAALGQNLGNLGTEWARRNLNVQPTLEIRSGYRFNIAVMKDLVLPGPYPAS